MLKLLMGDLTPIQGIRRAHRNLKTGHFSQHHMEHLDLEVSAVELLARKFPGWPEEEHRHQLGCCGISGKLAMHPVASLSRDQKSQAAFAQMTVPRSNLYILDELTNHLDMETTEALGRTLNSFRGGVILISHDERFLQLVCQELWVCEGGNVTRGKGALTSTMPSSRNSSTGRSSSRNTKLRTVPRTWIGLTALGHRVGN